MQTNIRLYQLLVLLIGYNTDIAAATSAITDTIINSRVTLTEFPITNLSNLAAVDLHAKKGDPGVYYGKWRWVSNYQDTFIITIQPNKKTIDSEGKRNNADVVCSYSIIRQGKLIDSLIGADSINSSKPYLFGNAFEKTLVIFPAVYKIENLDGGCCFFDFQVVADEMDNAIIKMGSLLPFFAEAFNKQLYAPAKTFPADLIMKKISNSY